MAQISGETPRMEAKRKLDEGLRNRAGGNAGVPEASVHSCILVRSPPTDMTQLVEDVANGSFEMFKRSRTETAGTGEKIPVRPYRDTSRWFTGEPAARTLPLHREHGTPFGQGGGSNQSREINVPIEMASAGGGAAGGGVAGGGAAGGGAPEGGAAGGGAAGGGAAGESAAGEGAAGEGAVGGGAAGENATGGDAAGGGAGDGRFDYGLKVRNDDNGDLSLYWTEDFMRVLEDRNFAIQLGSWEGGGKVILTCNAISDGA